VRFCGACKHRHFRSRSRYCRPCPEVGQLSAAAILAETGTDLAAFSTPEQMASWARIFSAVARCFRTLFLAVRPGPTGFARSAFPHPSGCGEPFPPETTGALPGANAGLSDRDQRTASEDDCQRAGNHYNRGRPHSSLGRAAYPLATCVVPASSSWPQLAYSCARRWNAACLYASEEVRYQRCPPPYANQQRLVFLFQDVVLLDPLVYGKAVERGHAHRAMPSPAEVNEFRNRCCRALWIFHSEQFVRSESDHFGPFGMGKNIELLLLNCIEDDVSDLERRHACLDGGLECGQSGLHFRGHRDRFVTQLRGPVTLGVGDICPHKPWAENRYFDE
jgi:hypothetical protein